VLYPNKYRIDFQYLTLIKIYPNAIKTIYLTLMKQKINKILWNNYKKAS